MAGRRKTSEQSEASGQQSGESAAQHDFSLWVQTDFNYTTPPFATLTEGIPPSDLEMLQSDFQSSLHQAYTLNNLSKLDPFPEPAGTWSGGSAAAGSDGAASVAGESDDDGLASEEKRKRNSAASARFRLKKKLNEQKLEHAAKVMTERAEYLQRRVRVLEAEVSYLRELVVLRHDRDRESELTAAADNMRAINVTLASNGHRH